MPTSISELLGILTWPSNQLNIGTKWAIIKCTNMSPVRNVKLKYHDLQVGIAKNLLTKEIQLWTHLDWYSLDLHPFFEGMVTYPNSRVNAELPESYEEEDISERAPDLSTRRGDEKCHCWTESDKDSETFEMCAFASFLVLLASTIIFGIAIFGGKRAPLEVSLAVTIVVCALLFIIFLIFRRRKTVMSCVRFMCPR